MLRYARALGTAALFYTIELFTSFSNTDKYSKKASYPDARHTHTLITLISLISQFSSSKLGLLVSFCLNGSSINIVAIYDWQQLLQYFSTISEKTMKFVYLLTSKIFHRPHFFPRTGFIHTPCFSSLPRYKDNTNAKQKKLVRLSQTRRLFRFTILLPARFFLCWLRVTLSSAQSLSSHQWGLLWGSCRRFGLCGYVDRRDWRQGGLKRLRHQVCHEPIL